MEAEKVDVGIFMLVVVYVHVAGPISGHVYTLCSLIGSIRRSLV